MSDVGVSTSPQLDASPAESSTEDSDDSLPLAQLALKRQEKGASSSHESSPELPTPTKPGPKKRGPRKQKKKKDPNAPKRPVSAYGAFFKDTHSAIREQNPNAGIGEVSKIVASMWEGLDPENKDSYKKKSLLARKEYLKELAAYKASQTSENGLENDPAVSVKPIATSGKKTRLKAKGRPKALFSVKPIGRRTRQQQAQVSSPDESNGLSPPEENPVTTESPPHESPSSMSPPQPDMIEEEEPKTDASAVEAEIEYNSPPHLENKQSPSPVEIAPKPTDNATDGNSQVVYSKWCIRNGCSNVALDNPGWDNEYCSNECVVSYCRDVFTAWVASRQSSS